MIKFFFATASVLALALAANAQEEVRPAECLGLLVNIPDTSYNYGPDVWTRGTPCLGNTICFGYENPWCSSNALSANFIYMARNADTLYVPLGCLGPPNGWVVFLAHFDYVVWNQTGKAMFCATVPNNAVLVGQSFAVMGGCATLALRYPCIKQTTNHLIVNIGPPANGI